MILQLLNSTLGLDFVNDHMIQLANFMGDFITKNSSSFTALARALGASFALVAIAGQLYKSIGRGEEIDIVALGRPLMFALLFGVWDMACQTLTAPGQLCEAHFCKVFEKQKDIVYEMRKERMVTSWNLADTIRARRAAARQAEMAATSGGTQSVWSLLEDGATWLKDQILRWDTIFQTFFATMLETVIMWLGELFWQCAIYYVFITKNLYIAVLSIFGPIFISASILPAWKDTWTKWVARMVTVSFYGTMAYIVMTFTLQIMVYTIEADIASMKQITGFISLGEYTSNLYGSSILTVTALFVGYHALMHLVPDLAAWVFPVDPIMGAGNFVSGLTRGSVGTGKAAGRMAVK